MGLTSGEKYEKLLAPETSNLIELIPHVTLDDAGDFHEAPIALGMAERIVKAFEIVYIALRRRFVSVQSEEAR